MPGIRPGSPPLAVLLATLLLLFMQGRVAGAQAEPIVIDLPVGQAYVLDEPNVRRIAVGNGRVVQVTALDQRQILLLPEAAGQSTLHLWGRNGVERQYLINVTPTDAHRTAQEINRLLDQFKQMQKMMKQLKGGGGKGKGMPRGFGGPRMPGMFGT